MLLAVLALLFVVRPAKPELSTAPQMRPKYSPHLRTAAAARARWLVWFPATLTSSRSGARELHHGENQGMRWGRRRGLEEVEDGEAPLHISVLFSPTAPRWRRHEVRPAHRRGRPRPTPMALARRSRRRRGERGRAPAARPCPSARPWP